MKQVIQLTVNNTVHEFIIDHHSTLLEVLREKIGLTGTKEGCGQGTCGACTVLVDGEAVLACLTLALSMQGKQIRTVEGLADGEELSRLQQALIDHGAVQCGFCTPGVLMSATAALNDRPLPDKQHLREALAGNLCRCTGYNQIIDAVNEVAREESHSATQTNKPQH